jgi:hypothetical protein
LVLPLGERLDIRPGVGDSRARLLELYPFDAVRRQDRDRHATGSR